MPDEQAKNAREGKSSNNGIVIGRSTTDTLSRRAFTAILIRVTALCAVGISTYAAVARILN